MALFERDAWRLSDVGHALTSLGRQCGTERRAEGHLKALELVFNLSCLGLIKPPLQDYYDHKSTQHLLGTQKVPVPASFPSSTGLHLQDS